MTTSLAQQLGALRTEQRDALAVPDRAKVSFLFDAKQASNIDDQTLWYICISGVRQLREARLIDLSAFESDLLEEKSLSFFRGGMTKEQLEGIDAQVDTLVRALSPHLMEPSALKVIEYLLRIYEAHIYSKETLLLAFMPLFESVYFLRIAQCLNLRQDQVWGWLSEFAYKGVSIDKPLLVKCISRNNGLIFAKCAQFCLEVGGHLHTKWFGSFLSEVLKTNKNEGLLFTVLPFISQALRQQESRDMRIACFLALGQLAARRSLSAEYTQAFVLQLIQSLQTQDKLEFDADLKLKGLQTLLFFTEYQRVRLDAKCLKYLLKVPKLQKLLAQLAKQMDTSSLSQAVIDSDASLDVKKTILEPLVNLKAIYMAVQSAIIATSTGQNLESSTELLKMLKGLSLDHFRQSVIYILKQVHEPQQRETIIKLLDSEGLHKNFGGVTGNNFSMLSALGSPQKHIRDAALSAICQPEHCESVDPREQSLIHLVLIQLIDQGGLDQESMDKLLSAVAVYRGQATDVDYEALMRLRDSISEGKIRYSKQTTDKIMELLKRIKVSRTVNQMSQKWLNATSNDSLEPDLILSLFQNPHSSFSYDQIASVLRKLTKSGNKSVLTQQLHLPILSCMKRRLFPNASDLLNAIVDSSEHSVKLVSKLIGASLMQKQLGGSLDLQALHKKVSGDQKTFAETMVRMAVSSNSKVKQLFAIQVLTAMHQKGKLPQQIQIQLSPKIMIGVVMMLLNDSDKQVREQAILLAEAVLALSQKSGEKLDMLDLFCDTDKPQSTQKKAVKLTPMKSKSVSSLLQELCESKSDLVLDRTQLKPVLSKHNKPEVFEEILRTLLDYPTFDLKQKLLAVLSLPQQHVMIFCMNLTQALPKIFNLVEKAKDPHVDAFLTTLGDLISHLQEYSASAAKNEIQKSLTIPYLKAVQDRKSLSAQVLKMFEQNIFVDELLKTEQRCLKEVFKIYLRAAADPKLRQLFTACAQPYFKGDDLAFCLRDVKEVELALETTVQLTSQGSSKLFEQALVVLSTQIQEFESGKDSSYSVQLAAQLAQQALPTKVKSLKDQIAQVVQMNQLVWQRMRNLVKLGLAQEVEKVDDPFNEYMKSDDVDGAESSQGEEPVDLLPCLQVTIALMGLLTDLEIKEFAGAIPQTTSLLEELADHLISTSEARNGAKSAIKSQLYHMYQSLVLRTTRTTNLYSQLIIKYTQTCIRLIDKGTMAYLLVDQHLALNVLKSVSAEYSALIYFTLTVQAVHSQVRVDENGLINAEGSAALYLLQELMLWQLDAEQELTGFSEYMYLVHSVAINEAQSVFIDQQTEMLFRDRDESNHLATTQRLIASESSDFKRRVVMLVCVLLTQWFSKNPKFLSTLGTIAGTETPTSLVQKQLLSVLLSSFIIREQVTLLLSQESTPKLVQLQSVVARWQSQLNSMMSLQIHIQLVMQILDMKSLQLKVNTLVLLLEKLSTFPGNWLSRCPVSLHKIACDLVQKCVTLLGEPQQQDQLSQLLLTVLSHTASTTLPKALQQETLKVSATQHRGSLQLQTQAVLTETTLMEVYALSVLDHFHTFLKHILEGFNEPANLEFIGSYKEALLKAQVCITQIFLKFLTADQLEQILNFSVVAASDGTVVKKPSDLVEMILENVASNAMNNKKLVLQATMNTYSTVAQSKLNDQQFAWMSDRYFTQLLAPVIRRLPQSFISEHYQKFVTFFKQMFSLPVQRPESVTSLVQCFNAFTLKLNEETLRPIVSSLSKWSDKASQRQIVFFHILCGCLDTLHEFFVPMTRIYFDSIVSVMCACHEQLGPTKLKKRAHSSLVDASFDLLQVTCRLTELTYKHDAGAFLQNDSFEALTEPIANLFELVSNQPESLVPSLRNMIFEMNERTTDDTMWQRLNFAMLLKTRSSSWRVRLAVLTVIDYLFERMRERFLVVLNDTIPFMSELLEDEDEKVEQAAKSIVQRIEQMTGESINDYLK